MERLLAVKKGNGGMPRPTRVFTYLRLSSAAERVLSTAISKSGKLLELLRTLTGSPGVLTTRHAAADCKNADTRCSLAESIPLNQPLVSAVQPGDNASAAVGYWARTYRCIVSVGVHDVTATRQAKSGRAHGAKGVISRDT